MKANEIFITDIDNWSHIFYEIHGNVVVIPVWFELEPHQRYRWCSTPQEWNPQKIYKIHLHEEFPWRVLHLLPVDDPSELTLRDYVSGNASWVEAWEEYYWNDEEGRPADVEYLETDDPERKIIRNILKRVNLKNSLHTRNFLHPHCCEIRGNFLVWGMKRDNTDCHVIVPMIDGNVDYRAEWRYVHAEKRAEHTGKYVRLLGEWEEELIWHEEPLPPNIDTLYNDPQARSFSRKEKRSLSKELRGLDLSVVRKVGEG